jgi:hypothetical protein
VTRSCTGRRPCAAASASAARPSITTPTQMAAAPSSPPPRTALRWAFPPHPNLSWLAEHCSLMSGPLCTASHKQAGEYACSSKSRQGTAQILGAFQVGDTSKYIVFHAKVESGGPCACLEQTLPGVEGLAVSTAADFALEIQRTAVENDVEPGPSCAGGWKAWVSAVRGASMGQMPSGCAGTPHHACMLQRLLRLYFWQDFWRVVLASLFVSSVKTFSPCMLMRVWSSSYGRGCRPQVTWWWC